MTRFPHLRTRALVVAASITIIGILIIARPQAANSPSPHPLKLLSGERYLTAVESESFLKAAATTRGGVVQFETLPTSFEREALQSLGVVFGSYIPDNAFIVSIPANVSMPQLESYGVRWAGNLSVDDKLTEALALYGSTPDWCLDQNGIPRFSMGLYPHVDLKDAEAWMNAEYGATIIGASKLGHSIEVALPSDNWQEIAADSRILWVEPFWQRYITNNSNRTNTNAEAAQAVPYSLSGNGIVVGEWDEGRADPSHADFGGRVISADASAISSHGTHVGGSVMGGGAAPLFTYRGMAPQALLLSHQWWNSASEMETEYEDAILNVDMALATNSWIVGFSPPTVANCNAFLGNYFGECGNLDDVVRGELGKPMPIVWAAGNERLTSSSYCGSVGFSFGSIPPFGTAKNVLTIGAINSNNSTMTSFSSWGPTDDGRLKPELVAPGCQTGGDGGVTSTKPGTGYSVACGTSMAAPTAAGCLALWMQRWNSTRFTPPFGSTVKAAFVESASDLGDPGPEYDWGYGRLNVTGAIDLLDQDRLLEDSVAHGETKSWTFENDGTISLASVTLAWDDPGAANNAAVTLINNLNLRLIPPSGPAQYLPWVLNPAIPANAATTGINTRDNLEQVRRTSPVEVGTWTVEVTGASVPNGPQRFSLAFSSGISLTSTNQAYAVNVEAASNPSSTIGVANLPFTLSNNGFNDDTYGVTLTSARGWAIASNPRTIVLNANSDSSLTFDLTIPPGTPYGTVDTVTATAESQDAPPLSSNDIMYVTVVSGRDVSVAAANDTVGVPGRTINLTARINNLGVFDDTVNWSVVNDALWSVVPSSGSIPVGMGGFVDIPFAVTIPANATPGVSNDIVVNVASEDDPTADGFDQNVMTVIALPPVAVLALPVENAQSNDNSQSLLWTHGAYAPPPPGFGDFSYYLDVREHPNPVTPVRYGPIADTFFNLPVLADGLYEWQVTTFNPLGDSSSPSSPAHFIIDTQSPLAPALDQPGDSLYEADTTVTFTWQTAAAAAEYKWEIAADAAFTTAVDSVWTVALSNARQLASCSTVVYWRVSSKDAAGNISAPSVSHRYAVYKVGDINFDCILNVIDVVQMIGVAFRGDPLPVPPGRAELLCNPPTDVTDVVRLIDVVFRNGAPPCGPS